MKYDLPLIDPRPLDPPSYWDLPEVDPAPPSYWHLLSDDHELEDYADTEEELSQLLPRYRAHGAFTVQQRHTT